MLPYDGMITISLSYKRMLFQGSLGNPHDLGLFPAVTSAVCNLWSWGPEDAYLACAYSFVCNLHSAVGCAVVYVIYRYILQCCLWLPKLTVAVESPLLLLLLLEAWGVPSWYVLDACRHGAFLTLMSS